MKLIHVFPNFWTVLRLVTHVLPHFFYADGCLHPEQQMFTSVKDGNSLGILARIAYTYNLYMYIYVYICTCMYIYNICTYIYIIILMFWDVHARNELLKGLLPLMDSAQHFFGMSLLDGSRI